MDASRPVTDPNTVYDMENLVVNSDGSLSLRKPITARTDIPIGVAKDARIVCQTHDPNLYIAIYENSIKLYDSSFKQITFRVDYTLYYSDSESRSYAYSSLGSDETATDEEGYYYTLKFDISSTDVLVLNTATLLTNVKVSRGDYNTGFAPDKNPVWRYIQIYEDTVALGTKVWVVKIVHPDVNILTESEEDYAIDANLLLDNAYAIRDRLAAPTPRIRGVLYYAPSIRFNTGKVHRYSVSENNPISVSNMWELTESTTSVAYRPVTSISVSDNYYDVIRAFVDVPKFNVYIAWFASEDGTQWTCITPDLTTKVLVEEGEDSEFKDVADTYYVPLKYVGVSADVTEITDVAPFDTEGKPTTGVAVHYAFGKYHYVIRIVSIKEESRSVTNDEGETEETTVNVVDLEYDRAVFTVPYGASDEFVYTEFPNASRGKKLYRNSTIFTYGMPELKSSILATYPGEFTTPIVNTIPASDVSGEFITTLLPWREYLISTTQSNIHLHTQVEGGWTTKTINTAMGIPEDDSKCCVAVLNGVMFKSGSKIYQLYPNVYSGTDTVLNVTDMSKPVEDFLIMHPGDGSQFAFSTESEYILMVPESNMTHCLRYNYTYKHWTRSTYPVKFYNYRTVTTNDIRLYGHQGGVHVEYYFDCAVDADYDNAYGDYLISYGTGSLVKLDVRPIHFVLDTGQKSDAIAETKQFVETKLMFATIDEEDSFPFTLHVAIDGDPHVVRKDVNTDAPFWKTEDNVSRGVAGTAFRLTTDSDSPASGTFNTLRQMIVRYSGKGKSIRHVIEGSSLYNFKMYETYVRYRNLNVKQ
jgi:hypothetical protein